MQSLTTRDRLVYPVAAVLALGLVSVPHHGASVPRLTEVATVRLQAEVSSIVTGLEGVTLPAAAVSPAGTGPAAAAAAATPCHYPCTVFDKFIDGLPPKIRNIVLPPLYSITLLITAVLSPVLLVTSAVFGWPYSLRSAAAANTARTTPAPAAATAAVIDPLPMQADPGPSEAGTPSSVPGETVNGANATVGKPIGNDDKPRPRERRITGAETNQIEVPGSPEGSAPALTASTVAVTTFDEVAPVADRPARTHARTRAAEAVSPDRAPASPRAAKRTAR